MYCDRQRFEPFTHTRSLSPHDSLVRKDVHLVSDGVGYESRYISVLIVFAFSHYIIQKYK